MMSQKLLASLLISCAFLGSSAVSAADLEANMKTLAKSTKAFAETMDVDKAKQQLVVMREAAVSSKQYLPHRLEGLSSENVKVKEYQAGLDQLVAEIDKVTVLVEQGQLDQAKAEAINLVKIRNENHKKFR
ncbi:MULTISPECIES: cytochrome b562 [Acinetobacter]|jgi:soluble cytochrome b562|uniref:Cytochrome B n=1 Tax=Acinetobacter pittii TaxID=48296 RepID=A0A242U839_ACIPI|nr:MULTISPECIES: cytochrome b562 [Acinetobacter]MBJ8503252.1 cytochrome b562 [Acinetobacter pittii]MBJ9894177.1 cytochrome b562 [Acinetobacter pittii]MCU4480325.1 cytochrome b562 [Acinetobacter sp. WU_MDCI_Abxd143]MEB7642988.1 cytochrome b562 [Acinetobacter pittii]OTU29854.1 cytochrome B [Acinetobacter pittii]